MAAAAGMPVPGPYGVLMAPWRDIAGDHGLLKTQLTLDRVKEFQFDVAQGYADDQDTQLRTLTDDYSMDFVVYQVALTEAAMISKLYNVKMYQYGVAGIA